MSRILYFCPDFAPPSGGTRTLYRHVCRLRACGFAAFIVHQRSGFALSWHGYQAPILALEDGPAFHPDDVWVIPEVMIELIRRTSGSRGRRVVIAQNWAPNYLRLLPGERWQDHGIARVMTQSPVIQRYLEWSMGIDVRLFAAYVDPARYVRDLARKQRKVVYMTRKNSSGAVLRGLLLRKTPSLADYTWVALQAMDVDTYARHVREAAVFLATSTQEGLPASVLEAMACGCLVVGYDGVGGASIMVGHGDAQNCVLVENGDLPAFGEALERVLVILLDDPDRYARIVDRAVRTARPYQDVEAEARSLVTFFDELGAARTTTPA